MVFGCWRFARLATSFGPGGHWPLGQWVQHVFQIFSNVDLQPSESGASDRALPVSAVAGLLRAAGDEFSTLNPWELNLGLKRFALQLICNVRMFSECGWLIKSAIYLDVQ